MKTFLEYVAEDILTKYKKDLAHVAVVFPNKRASLFLNQAIARMSDGPVWSPSYITISDLFRQHSTLTVIDPIKAVSMLHKSYTKVTGSNESLDKFFGWGQLLLADFDDIDKNMADATRVFRNLTDLHEMDDLTYLDETQRQLIQRFFSNFVDADTKLKERFMSLWSKMAELYDDYTNSLLEKGYAYEGLLYRKVAESPGIEFLYERYLFVGFNVLQKVEQQLFTRLKSEGKAFFYWDYDRYYVNSDSMNEAGVYIRQWLDKFPNELDDRNAEIYDNIRRQKTINYIGAATEDIQARYITTWLRENDRLRDGNRTAVVLCDENLLHTVIHCIPPETEKVNVTTGYPLQQTPIASLVTQLLALQLNGWDDAHRTFRLHHVNIVLRHPYARYVSSQSHELLKLLNAHKRFYPVLNELRADDGLAALFARERLVVGHERSADGYDLAEILVWLKDVVKRVAQGGRNDADPLFQESVFRMYTLLNNLLTLFDDGDLDVDVYTFQHLMTQLVNSTSIPFHGEPAVGVQIMGVLETRNLDFDHVLVLSCNEGNMPKGVNDSSFIPHALRASYGLTTVDNKVAVYSYYFHSLLQRASDVTLVYNSSTEGMNTGEMSRFMLQLMVELGQPIHKYSLQAGQLPLPVQPETVEKDERVMARMNNIRSISPTALNKYIKCPLSFFYSYVAGIKEADDGDEDEIDNRIFGNIFHKAAQLMYEKPGTRLKTIVDEAFNIELFHLPDGTQTEPALNGLQLINREVITRYLKQLKALDKQLGKYEIIGHELDAFADVQLSDRKLRIGGRIDRLDRVHIGEPGECLRVVDYKTGSRVAKDVKEIADVFSASNIHTKHSDYILQAMIYSAIVADHDMKNNPAHDHVSPALLFIQHAGAEGYDPVLTVDGERVTNISRYRDDLLKGLKEKLEELFNPAVPFSATTDLQSCQSCPYRMICGR